MQTRSLKKQQGLSLIEMIGAISIIAIVNAIAVPTFSDTIERNELRSNAERVMTTLALARSEAVKRNQPVSICRSSDGATCTGDWDDGWIVFSNPDQDNVVDAGTDVVIRSYDGLAESLRFEGTVGEDSITFFADGSYAGESATVRICPPDNDQANTWEVDVNMVGRPRLSKGASSCG